MKAWARKYNIDVLVFLLVGFAIIALGVMAGIQSDKNRNNCQECIQEKCEECMDVCGADE